MLVWCPGSMTGIRIGFVQEQYTVSESDGFAVLEVAVLDGQLQNMVFIPFFTQDGSATGMGYPPPQIGRAHV